MNVFLVLSPLQVINALEARAFFGTEDNVLVVLRHTSSGYPVSMFRHLVDETQWSRAEYHATYGEERVGYVNKYVWAYLSLLEQRRLDRLAASLGSVDGLFVGSYLEPLVRHFSNTLPHRTLTILDSGTDTLMVNRARKRSPKYGPTRLPPLPSKMSLLSKLLNVRDKQAERVTFFTAFDIEVEAHDTLVKNQYQHFRTLSGELPAGDEVWFLGGPLVVDHYVSEAVYFRYLEAVRAFYGDKTFVYVPHSREQRADLEKIETLLGCEVRPYGLPVELVLSRANPRPSEIVSFITTALTSCHLMFGETLQITAVQLDPEHFPKYHAFVRDIYRQFRREADEHFRVLTLEQLQPSGSQPSHPAPEASSGSNLAVEVDPQ